MTGRLVVVSLVLTSALVTFGGPADATPAWSIQPSPSPLGPARAQLHGLSCVSSTNCMAVGYSIQPKPRPYAQRLDGTKWLRTSVPATTRPVNVLLAVACPA